MSTKVIPLTQGVRIVSGRLAPHIEIDWAGYSMAELEMLLAEVMRIEVEHNQPLHKGFKDKKGANVEVFKGLNHIKVSSVGEELLYIQDSLQLFDSLHQDG